MPTNGDPIRPIDLKATEKDLRPKSSEKLRLIFDECMAKLRRLKPNAFPPQHEIDDEEEGA